MNQNGTNDSDKKHVFIINPKSFNFDEQKIQKFTASVRQHFSESAEKDGLYFHVSRFPRDATGVLWEIIRNVSKTQIIRVFAVGGDGILFDCLNGVVGFPNCELGNIPYGTTNDFLLSFGHKNARNFLNIRKQLAAPVVPIDVINCGTNYALNVALVGLEAEAAFLAYKIIGLNRAFFDKFPKLASKAFFLSGLITFFNMKKMRGIKYKIKIDGEQEIEDRFITINIANGSRYGGKITAMPQAVPSDGILNVLCVRPIPFLQKIKICSDYLKGRWVKNPDYFIYETAKKIKISSGMPIAVNLDGEAFRDLFLELKVIPSAVKFIVPGYSTPGYTTYIKASSEGV